MSLEIKTKLKWCNQHPNLVECQYKFLFAYLYIEVQEEFHFPHTDLPIIMYAEISVLATATNKNGIKNELEVKSSSFFSRRM